MIKFRIVVCKITFLLICLTSLLVISIDNAIASSSQSEYSAAVAELLIDLENTDSITSNQKRGSISRVVLTRVNAGDIDVSAFSPLTVLSGPKGKYTILFSSVEDAREAIIYLKAQDNVVYAEMDSPVVSCETHLYEEGEYSFHSWAAERMGFPSILDMANKEASGSVLVAIIDSGVAEHRMIRPRLSKLGFDYVDNDLDPTNDESGHGTHVAGIVVDCTPSLSVNIMPIRVLNENGGGQIANAINAIDEAVDSGCGIINLSLVSPNLSEAFDDAVNRAVASGVIVVVAAGNNGSDVSYYSPVHMQTKGLIVVGSVESNGSVASYSNYGASVDVFAYGSSITSCAVSGSYISRSGTSMAAPHITAACAILRLLHQASGPASCETILTSISPDPIKPVPLLSNLVPIEVGMTASTLVLRVGDTINLLSQPIPSTCTLDLQWSSSNSQVVTVENNLLTAASEGEAILSVCFSQQELKCKVTVYGNDHMAAFVLPQGLETIDDEAFMGLQGVEYVQVKSGVSSIGNRVFDGCNSLLTVFLPSSIKSIGLSPFSSATLVVTENSFAYTWAVTNDQPYIIDTGQ